MIEGSFHFTPEQFKQIIDFDSFLQSLPLAAQAEALSELTSEYQMRLPEEVRGTDGVHRVIFREEDVWTEPHASDTGDE